MSTKDNVEYRFTPTQDWFSVNVDSWRLLFPLVESKSPRVLEVGSWEGRSAVFLLTELCTNSGDITCIDHFDLMSTEAGRERYTNITHNLSITGKPFRVIDEFSIPGLMRLLEEETTSPDAGYDWIYVDGSHEADDTFLDGELCWRLARKGAIIIFDDYHWDTEPEESIHHPKRGIDSFMTLHSGEFEVLSSPTQYQMILRKTSSMRIGFLVKDKAHQNIGEAFGYGMNIAIATDPAYAMAAAVAIHSVIAHTKSRLTIYVLDLGLGDNDRNKLRRSMPRRADATMVFIPLDYASERKEKATWAKIDMIDVLPVERVLYLDADVLVRADIWGLWSTDLRGKPIGAAIDVGFPEGHNGTVRKPYFNAGVLLLDLAAVRRTLQALQGAAREYTTSRFRDQDLLNAYFEANWAEVSLKWNAQGIATYAELPTEARQNIDMGLLKNPYIVHFTGPVNPTLEVVLNPYIQPYTAKPWGYAGAPGHPHGEEWWNVVEQTAWKGWRASEEYRMLCASEKERAIRAAVDKFEQTVEQRLEV
ncbi:predicted protein [Postia placenta Mad-698-R]|nr:predicted protein [Postia placenta Mad-698-R]